MSAKVLFVITNIDGFYDDAYSFGLASLMSYIEDKGYEYDLAVINSKDEFDSLFVKIDAMKPDVIGYTSVSSQFMHVEDLSNKVREKFEDTIQICGGIHVTIFPESILQAKGLDGIFVGEGEYAFSEFLNRVSNNFSYKDVKNFVYVENNKLKKNDTHPLIKNLDELPFPVRDKFSYNTRFLNKKKKWASFWFTRGCPYNCTYCCNHAFAKTYNMNSLKPRYRSPDNCMEEIKQVVEKYNIKEFWIGDDTFGLSKKWTKEFCEKYASQIKLPFRAKLRCNLVNRELMDQLKNAGCVYIYSSIESGNEYIRNEIMNRNMKNEHIINAYSLYREYNIPASACFIIGVPQDTEATIWESVEINRIIQPSNTRANIFYPYKGTILGDYCFKEGLVDEEAFTNFSQERSGSVLKFDPEFKEKLVYFHKNFRILSRKYGRPKAFIMNHFPHLAKMGMAVKQSLPAGIRDRI
jgi:anaerobic magnesium-protoporphyrin IX monomethyl ester cyclase